MGTYKQDLAPRVWAFSSRKSRRSSFFVSAYWKKLFPPQRAPLDPGICRHADDDLYFWYAESARSFKTNIRLKRMLFPAFFMCRDFSVFNNFISISAISIWTKK